MFALDYMEFLLNSNEFKNHVLQNYSRNKSNSSMSFFHFFFVNFLSDSQFQKFCDLGNYLQNQIVSNIPDFKKREKLLKRIRSLITKLSLLH